MAGGLGGARLFTPGEDEDDDDEADRPRAGLHRIVWSVTTDRPRAALTFDDGPHPTLTPAILDVLSRYGIAATFMMLGHAVEQHPGLVSEVLAAGHEVGNHSWRHLNLARATVTQTREEIEVGARMIEEVSGVPVTMFRPPRGRLNEAALRLLAPLGQDIVLWSVTRGALDWQSPRRVASHVIDSLGHGGIIGFHDGIGRWTFDAKAPRAQELLRRRRVEIEALPLLLEGIAERGIELVPVSQLLPAPGPREAG